jgi:hypothetical protein
MSTAPRVAIIDGPYDASALKGILARPPIDLGRGHCDRNPRSACGHGTFILGLLGAAKDVRFPGLCPECQILQIPLFDDEDASEAGVADLAYAITQAVQAGAQLINLSLAILDADAQHDWALENALNDAEARGAVVIAAAGNQGRFANGQLLSHAVTIPVVAVDARGEPLPSCNFGPAIARRGISAPGDAVSGYAPGGELTKMSGTSVATAVATGLLAQVWAARPGTSAAKLRAAVARLGPRDGRAPPLLDTEALLTMLDRSNPRAMRHIAPAKVDERRDHGQLQGDLIMGDYNRFRSNFDRRLHAAAPPGPIVAPAQAPDGCGCGGAPGACTCKDGPSWPACANAGSSAPNFVYVLGTVDVCFPDESISDEMQAVARTIGIRKHTDHPRKYDKDCMNQGHNEEVRSWCHRVMSDPDYGREARYVARQLSWMLKVEGQPAYYLVLRDWHDLGDLISCLGEPKGDDLCLVVGSSSLIPVETCPGVTAPILLVDYLCSFKHDTLTKQFDTESPKAGAPSSKELFAKFVQSADNFGDTDEWRALNYLAVQYQPLYDRCKDILHNPNPECNYVLDSFKVVKSRLWGEKRIVDPVFAFRDTKTGDVRKWFVRVDVSHLFPMIANDIAEYFDR